MPLLIISGTIGAAFNSLWLYTSGFDKYDVSAEMGLSDAELKRAAQELISYFNSPNQKYLVINVTYDSGQTGPLYDQADMDHMKDVKGLLWLDYGVCLASAGYILLYAMMFWVRKRSGMSRELATSAWCGGVVTLGLMTFLGLFAVTSFDWFFTKFHQILFPQGNYEFSAYDHMVIMFPHAFWFDTALTVGLVAVGLGLLTAGIGWLVLSKLRRRENRLILM